MNVTIKDIGRSVTIMDDKELEVRAIKDVKAAFNYVAGRGNGPADRSYTAHGLRTSIDNVMVDGLRSMQGGEGGTGSRLPSTFNADNTTFLRGTEALLYGAGVAGGLVNIITKKTSETPATTLGMSNRSYVSSDTGNFKRNDTRFNLDSTGPITNDNVLYRVLAQHTPSGDHFQKGRVLKETLTDELSYCLAAALNQHQNFAAATYIKKLMPFLISKTTNGGGYGEYIDDALMHHQGILRTDISCTTFLSAPDSCQGGELVINLASVEMQYKLAAGDAVIYPSTTLHRVNPVTQGERLAALTWLESHISCANKREVLYNLDCARRQITKQEGKNQAFDLITKPHANVLRTWAET